MGLPVSHIVGAMDKERSERRVGSTWDWGGGRARDKIQRLDDSNGEMSSNHCWTLQTGIRARLPADFPSSLH